MDDQLDSFLSFLNTLDKSTVAIICAVVFYAFVKNWPTISAAIDTYFTGKFLKEKQTKKDPNDEIMRMLASINRDLSRLKEPQQEMLKNQNELRAELNDLRDMVVESNETTTAKIEYISNQCDFLKVCDKEDKKAYITREFNYFTRLGEIDLFSKETLEKIYELYLKENGDTFVAGMMSQIRILPVAAKKQLNPNALIVPEPAHDTVVAEIVEPDTSTHS